MSGFAAAWLRAKGRTVSPFGETVAEILGDTYRGIYHIEQAVTHRRVEWHHRDVIRVVLVGELATWDGAELTQLVLRCLRHGVRLSVRGAAPNYLTLTFTTNDDGSMWLGRMPSPEAALARYAPSSTPTEARPDA